MRKESQKNYIVIGDTRKGKTTNLLQRADLLYREAPSTLVVVDISPKTDLVEGTEHYKGIEVIRNVSDLIGFIEVKLPKHIEHLEKVFNSTSCRDIEHFNEGSYETIKYTHIIIDEYAFLLENLEKEQVYKLNNFLEKVIYEYRKYGVYVHLSVLKQAKRNLSKLLIDGMEVEVKLK